MPGVGNSICNRLFHSILSSVTLLHKTERCHDLQNIGLFKKPTKDDTLVHKHVTNILTATTKTVDSTIEAGCKTHKDMNYEDNLLPDMRLNIVVDNIAS